MRQKTKEALNDTQFVDECRSFTCELKRSMNNCSDAVPDQIGKNLSSLDNTIGLMDVPFIGSVLIWMARHSGH
jgi:hypothetical protein